MKIVLSSVQDVHDFLQMVVPVARIDADKLSAEDYAELLRADRYRTGQIEPEASDEPTGLPTDIPQPAPLAAASEALDDSGAPVRDADGVEWHQDWHSEPAKLNVDGRFKAKRGRDKDAYAEWTLEQQRAFEATPVDEPVATETHALPPSKPAAEEPQDAAPAATAIDLQALVASCAEASLDAPDSIMDLLNQAKAFIVDHSKGTLDDLKAVIAPLEDGTGGKPLQMLDPGQRRLLSACMTAYPTGGAA